jgi:hypothetical protein
MYAKISNECRRLVRLAVVVSSLPMELIGREINTRRGIGEKTTSIKRPILFNISFTSGVIVQLNLLLRVNTLDL